MPELVWFQTPTTLFLAKKLPISEFGQLGFSGPFLLVGYWFLSQGKRGGRDASKQR
jgi:hypothetical protein